MLNFLKMVKNQWMSNFRRKRKKNMEGKPFNLSTDLKKDSWDIL